MKIGDEVVCIGDNFPNRTHCDYCGYINSYPIKNEIYTIREFDYTDEVSILVNEIHNPIYDYRQGMYECSFRIRFFRELHYNASAISELLEERKVEKG